jgi:methionine-gamma-lyase
MGAITALVWTLLQQGDEVVADKTHYGCSFGLFHHQIRRFGVKTRFADLADPAVIASAISPSTRRVFTETPSNPNMRIVDISALAAACRRQGALLVVDNTYCTPYLQKPISLGADVVVHSATKYLGGHGDLLAGAVVGRKELIDRVRFVGIKEMNGACISPFDAFLVLRGLKTLALRMDRHCATAMKLARDLRSHRAVDKVFYPGLDDHPQHALASTQMQDFGGMIALELRGGLAAGQKIHGRSDIGDSCGQSRRRRDACAASGQHDACDILAGRKREPRVQRRTDSYFGRAGRLRRSSRRLHRRPRSIGEF